MAESSWSFAKSSTNWRPSIQTYEPLEATLPETITRDKEGPQWIGSGGQRHQLQLSRSEVPLGSPCWTPNKAPPFTAASFGLWEPAVSPGGNHADGHSQWLRASSQCDSNYSERQPEILLVKSRRSVPVASGYMACCGAPTLKRRCPNRLAL